MEPNTTMESTSTLHVVRHSHPHVTTAVDNRSAAHTVGVTEARWKPQVQRKERAPTKRWGHACACRRHRVVLNEPPPSAPPTHWRVCGLSSIRLERSTVAEPHSTVRCVAACRC